VSEELDQGRRNFHCRLLGQWSFTAMFAFWSIVAAQILLIGVVAAKLPWIWMVLITIPFMSLLLDHQYHEQEDLVALQLAESASDLKLVQFSGSSAKAQWLTSNPTPPDALPK